ncbi:retropepsin-like protein, partial [Trifolium medium]|nr:retropepsin-like protein [Trifolium medium]
ERFKHLVSSCPQHQISEQLLIQYFYEGLIPMDRNILDAASGGALVDKTPAAARALIENMSLNSQQFTTRNNFVAHTRGVCGICTSSEHPTDTCPILHDESITELPQAYAANVYNQSNIYNAPDLSTNKYHPSWRNHQLLRYGNPTAQQLQQQLQVPLSQPTQPTPPPTVATSGPSLEDVVKQMASSINDLKTQKVEAVVGTSAKTSDKKDKNLEKNKSTPIAPAPTPNTPASSPEPDKEYSIPLPFPQKAVKSIVTGQSNEERDILDVFKKVEVNIPLIEAIKQVPKYAKCLKEMCTNKRKLKGNSRVNMSRNVSSIIEQTELPEKCEDLGVFTVPCTIGNTEFGLVIQLANRSITRRKKIHTLGLP